MTIGTWNVAGKVPTTDLEIDDWLCLDDPADIYILGLVYESLANLLALSNLETYSRIKYLHAVPMLPSGFKRLFR